VLFVSIARSAPGRAHGSDMRRRSFAAACRYNYNLGYDFAGNRDGSLLLRWAGAFSSTSTATCGSSITSACSMQHGQRIIHQPLDLLRSAGFEVREVRTAACSPSSEEDRDLYRGV